MILRKIRHSKDPSSTNQSHLKLKVCVVCSIIHLEESKAASYAVIDVNGLTALNKDNAKIKKWAKKYDVLIANNALIKQITKLLGNIMVKIGKHLLPINEG